MFLRRGRENPARKGIEYPQKDRMTKTLEAIREAILNSKHPFQPVADRPAKPQKHRYERRKVKHYIRVVDWTESEPWSVMLPVAGNLGAG
jgi:hypothetical protein